MFTQIIQGRKIIVAVSAFLALILVIFFLSDKMVLKEQPAGSAPTHPGDENSVFVQTAPVQGIFSAPLSRWAERVTKKPFRVKISPQTSPVQPERFSGYHTGADFEIFPHELNEDVPVYAVCSGSLKSVRTVAGYGGVAVEACLVEEAAVAVVYGHIRVESLKFAVGDSVEAGDLLGVLGKAYSPETDGERKHLHLSIHKGADIDLRGYVSRQAELEQWIDPASLL